MGQDKVAESIGSSQSRNNESEIKQTKPVFPDSNFGNVYAAVVQTRNTEITVYWNRYNILGAMVFGLIVAVSNSRPDTIFAAQWGIACLAGLFLTFIWGFVAVTGRALFVHWQNCAADLEEDPHKWKVFTTLIRSPRISFYIRLISSFKQLVSQPYTYIALSLPAFAAVLWILLLINPPQKGHVTTIDQVSQEIDNIKIQIMQLESKNDNKLIALKNKTNGFAAQYEIADLRDKLVKLDLVLHSLQHQKKLSK